MYRDEFSFFADMSRALATKTNSDFFRILAVGPGHEEIGEKLKARVQVTHVESIIKARKVFGPDDPYDLILLHYPLPDGSSMASLRRFVAEHPSSPSLIFVAEEQIEKACNMFHDIERSFVTTGLP